MLSQPVVCRGMYLLASYTPSGERSSPRPKGAQRRLDISALVTTEKRQSTVTRSKPVECRRTLFIKSINLTVAVRSNGLWGVLPDARCLRHQHLLASSVGFISSHKPFWNDLYSRKRQRSAPTLTDTLSASCRYVPRGFQQLIRGGGRSLGCGRWSCSNAISRRDSATSSSGVRTWRCVKICATL